MGWGNHPHEGYAEERRSIAGWTGGTTRAGQGERIEMRAACSCGWAGADRLAIPARPAGEGADLDGYFQQLEDLDEQCRAEWHVEHLSPLLDEDPNNHLVLARTNGGPRHFLAGQPVHAGEPLELQLDGGTWLPVTYEWSWQPDRPPTGTIALAGPPGAARAGVEPPVARLDLPPSAVLRWPDRDASR